MTVLEMPIDPPDDDRKVVATCEWCGRDILQFEEVLYSHDLQLNFCDKDCLYCHWDIEKKYYD